MARYLFLDPSYFSRYFKRMTGLTFTDYVHQHKMKVATKMLKISTQNLESLAVGLGYSDRTYFSKVFKNMWEQRRANINPNTRYAESANLNLPNKPAAHLGRFFCCRKTKVKILHISGHNHSFIREADILL